MSILFPYEILQENAPKTTTKYLPKSTKKETKTRPGATLGAKTKPVREFPPPRSAFGRQMGPKGDPKIKKIHKSRKQTEIKTHLESRPGKVSKITDFWTLPTPPD